MKLLLLLSLFITTSSVGSSTKFDKFEVRVKTHDFQLFRYENEEVICYGVETGRYNHGGGVDCRWKKNSDNQRESL